MYRAIRTRLIHVFAALIGLIGTAVRAGDVAFDKTQLNSAFLSEGVTVADVNRDGMLDVLAGPLWYEAPEWTPHEISVVKKYQADGGYSESFANFAADVNGDGWTDQIVIGFPNDPAHWYENPQGRPGHWKAHEIFRSACNESPQFADLTGDGKLELVMGFEPELQMAWFTPGADPNGLWDRHLISTLNSEGTRRYYHGLGVGDVNSDGRNDVLIPHGWWQAPRNPKRGPWEFHPIDLGQACSDMHVYDVDGDGDNDVLSSSAHSYGIWWHEQITGSDGTSDWKTHTITNFFSQTHSLALVDINGDGLKDLVTGKRYYAHHGNDPGGKEAAVLYWFELRRTTTAPRWIAHLIDDDSGVGTQFLVRDINADKRPDIITSNKKGVFVFRQVTGQ